MGVTLFYFYSLQMITYPWASYKLTPSTPRGNWTGTLELRGGLRFLVNIDMTHDTVFSETQPNAVPDISGKISICPASGVVTTSTVWGDQKWTGSSMVLGAKTSSGANVVPEAVTCLAKKMRRTAFLILNAL